MGFPQTLGSGQTYRCHAGKASSGTPSAPRPLGGCLWFLSRQKGHSHTLRGCRGFGRTLGVCTDSVADSRRALRRCRRGLHGHPKRSSRTQRAPPPLGGCLPFLSGQKGHSDDSQGLDRGRPIARDAARFGSHAVGRPCNRGPRRSGPDSPRGRGPPSRAVPSVSPGPPSRQARPRAAPPGGLPGRETRAGRREDARKASGSRAPGEGSRGFRASSRRPGRLSARETAGRGGPRPCRDGPESRQESDSGLGGGLYLQVRRATGNDVTSDRGAGRVLPRRTPGGVGAAGLRDSAPGGADVDPGRRGMVARRGRQSAVLAAPPWNGHVRREAGRVSPVPYRDGAEANVRRNRGTTRGTPPASLRSDREEAGESPSPRRRAGADGSCGGWPPARGSADRRRRVVRLARAPFPSTSGHGPPVGAKGARVTGERRGNEGAEAGFPPGGLAGGSPPSSERRSRTARTPSASCPVDGQLPG